MPNQVIMPQLGESVVEGTITRWLKEEGDEIEEYEPLLEVNTDKVDSEIPSPFSGTVLKILVSEGTTVQAGEPLAWIGQEGETAPGEGTGGKEQTKTGPVQVNHEADTREAEAARAARPVELGTIHETQPAMEERPEEGERSLGFISPVVGKIASEHNLDLTQVTGTGMGGRITKKDVLAYLDRLQAEGDGRQLEERAPAEMPAPGRAPRAMPGEIMPLNAVRRAIADHMVFSKHTSPHVTTIMEADLHQVVSHREANKAAYARDGVNLTYTAYFIAAAVAALKEYPLVNSSWREEGILLHRQINIGMAASLGEEGLIVPVIKNADEYSLLGLARAINDLAGRARSKKLQPDEVKGGTFTITNHGTSGSLFATPIINQPQCGILGVGAVQKRVVVINDAIAIRPMVYASLTFDHRILDGAVADSFLGKVVETLENWRTNEQL